AKADDRVTLLFTTDERVDGVEVKINGSSYSAMDMRSGTSWEAQHTVSSGGDAETVQFEITSFNDPVGNELTAAETYTSDDALMSVRVDTTSPQVSTVTFASSNLSSDPDYSDALLAKADDMVTLSFTTDERVGSPVARINGQPVPVGSQEDEAGTADASGTKWRAVYAVSVPEEGEAVDVNSVSFEIVSLNDPAGNALGATSNNTATTDSSRVRIDLSAPKVTVAKLFSSNTAVNTVEYPGYKLARPTDTVTLEFETGERVLNPVAKINGQPVSVESQEDEAGTADASGTKWQAEYTVATALLMSKYEHHQSFSNHMWIRKDHPVVSDLASGATVSFLCNGNKLGPFTTSGLNPNDGKNVLEEEGRLEGTGDGLAFFNINGDMTGCRANADDFAFLDPAASVADIDATFEIVSLNDPSGNALAATANNTATTDSSKVRIDLSAPQVTVAKLLSSNAALNTVEYPGYQLARLTDTVTLEFETDERVLNPTAKINEQLVIVTRQRDAEDSEITTGTKWQASYPLTESLGSQDIDSISFEVVSLNDPSGSALAATANNTATTDSSKIRIDLSAPQVT
ncbi:MAG: hypothetical protein QF614_05315, partial [SAR324 cluster bacterium]|nr:hypothetical protein [SAR324 cluster bacterium]